MAEDDDTDATPTPAPLTAAELARLAAKYAALADLRRARARGEAIPERAVFRELAREFPGVLNELDNLPLEEIEGRLEALLHAQAGEHGPRWIPWMHRYHALMRAALYVKIRVARGEAPSGEEAATLAARASAHAGIAVGADFVVAVKSPPAGRLNRLVFGRLAGAFGVPEDELRAALFPGRPRPGNRL